MKDAILPKLYTKMRDTLLQAEWHTVHSDPEDTFVVLVSPDNVIRCVLHYMIECTSVYPDGSWTMKLNTDEGTWQVETATRPISENTAAFMHDFCKLSSIGKLLKDEIKKDPF